jgi:nicotinamidase-related amidase
LKIKKKMKAAKIHLLVIDPQVDFMDSPKSNLPVPGANGDMDRLALMVKNQGRRLADIHVTLDSHQLFHIAHPSFWVDGNGKNPPPFTQIRHDDVKNSIWTPSVPGLRAHALAYTEALEKAGQYIHTIWNPHCLIGTPGHNVQANLNDSLQEWIGREKALINYVTKGGNYLVEHFGALQAEVTRDNDPTTQLNTGLLDMLRTADCILIAGEAFSHCVRATVQQIADNIGDDHIKKLTILTDCTSCIPAITAGGKVIVDFPGMTATWLKGMEKRGLVTSDSVAFWK